MNENGSVRSVSDAVVEAAPLVAAFEAELRRDPAGWAPSMADGLHNSWQHRTLNGVVWSGSEGAAIGLAFWDPPAEVGRRWAAVYLVPSERTTVSLSAFLDCLDELSARQGPIVSVTDLIPGFSPEEKEKVFRPRGFRRAVRLDMTYPNEQPLPPSSPLTPPPRALAAGDVAGLTDLAFAAYADDPRERVLFSEYRDPRVEAREGMEGLLRGKWGTWWPSASFGIEREGHLVAATMVNDHHGPLVTEVLVEPEFRRRGFARALLRESVRGVREMGPRAPRLVVTRENERAYRLYASAGWVEVPNLAGGVWLKTASVEPLP